ncbi:hypothetical protein WN944_025449 [Citrus x changshan-huyou]|uniref:Fumarylacetoacetase-like C-terminal domain-containing protein n=1 Tax=Citrus x changshan-huyou TaxID=2935761 RepID=A0AAP0LT75_9ROSI
MTTIPCLSKFEKENWSFSFKADKGLPSILRLVHPLLVSASRKEERKRILFSVANFVLCLLNTLLFDLFKIYLQLPKSAVPDPHNLELWLKVDGEIRQKGFTKDMIFKIPYLISHISSIVTLVQGDVMLTLNRAYYAYEGVLSLCISYVISVIIVIYCTPQGVGPVKVGQKITAGITGLLDVHFDIEKRRRPGSA